MAMAKNSLGDFTVTLTIFQIESIEKITSSTFCASTESFKFFLQKITSRKHQLKSLSDILPVGFLSMKHILLNKLAVG